MKRRRFLHIFRQTTAGVMTLLTGASAGILATSFDRDPFVGVGLLGAEIACVLGGLILYLLFALVSTLLCPKEDAGD